MNIAVVGMNMLSTECGSRKFGLRPVSRVRLGNRRLSVIDVGAVRRSPSKLAAVLLVSRVRTAAVLRSIRLTQETLLLRSRCLTSYARTGVLRDRQNQLNQSK